MMLTKSNYAQLKNLSYKYCLLDIEKGDNKARKAMSLELAKYNDSKLNDVIMHTFDFPYDFELCDFLMKNDKLSDENILLASSTFHISSDLVRDKCREYVEYGFMDSLHNEKIDGDLIKKLSNAYFDVNPNEK